MSITVDLHKLLFLDQRTHLWFGFGVRVQRSSVAVTSGCALTFSSDWLEVTVTGEHLSRGSGPGTENDVCKMHCAECGILAHADQLRVPFDCSEP